ncbi:MAG: hypothetical protein HEQ35_29680 [Gloeotrichia echinulata IR180]
MNAIFSAQIEIFYQRFRNCEYEDPLDLAQALDRLSDEAWDMVDETIQPSLKIDP